MRLLFIVIFLCISTAELQAQTSPAKWYKGNTHAHSYWSDGNDFPEMVMEWYKSHGYNFICLSDHNVLAQGELWKPVYTKPPSRMVNQRWFDRYLEKYGEDWVTYKKDSTGRLQVKLKTLEEYRPLFEEKGKFLIMPAEEISANGLTSIHMCAVNNKEELRPLEGKTITEVLQKNLDQVYEQRKRTGQLMLAHINHPNYRHALSLEDMLPLKGARFFEVFNGHPLVNNYGDSVTMGTEELWDKLQIGYIRDGKPLIYGVGTEDSHEYHSFKAGKGTPGRAWIMVKAPELTPDALIKAMEKGDFYATTGVELRDIAFKNRELEVQVKPEAGVDYTIQFWGAAEKSRNAGVLLKEVKGTEAAYKMGRSVLFVRAKIISSKLKDNPFKKGDLETAWTQPVTIR